VTTTSAYLPATRAASALRSVGELLREWRHRRRLSQLDLAIEADISARHLSFVETGRSRPTSQMILQLAEHLDVPLRERNALLLAGGYAPAYPQRGLGEPELAAVRAALRQVLDGHQPYPALVVNRWWELLDANPAVPVLTAGAAPWLLEPPVNVLRLSLHPDGMAPRIANLAEWRAHVLARLHRQAATTADPRLDGLHEELRGYPGGLADTPPGPSVMVPLRYRLGGTELALFSTTAVIGTPRDVTVDELAIEAFYPADTATASALQAASQTRPAHPAG
jgi:transcriptional regulator with XRE-family HTH domain